MPNGGLTGKFYWYVQRSEGDGLWLHADRVEVMPDGTVLFWCEQPVYALSGGSWEYFYAAERDGSPLAITHAGSDN